MLVGIEPGTSRSRVRCFTTAPQRSTFDNVEEIKHATEQVGHGLVRQSP